MYRKATLALFGLAIVAGSLGLAQREASAFRHKSCAPTKEVAICVDDPCDCCPGQEVCVCVPCCCTEEPSVCWRNGLFGRRVATLSWPCCGYSVEVVVTKHGEYLVR